MDDQIGRAGVSFDALVQALGSAVATVAAAPAGTGFPVASVALLEATDLVHEAGDEQPDLGVVVGATESELAGWLRRQLGRPSPSRARGVATKIDSSALGDAADRAGLALLKIHPQARIDVVLHTVRSLLSGAEVSGHAAGQDDATSDETDLYGLAQTVAGLTGGLVSIEDERAQLLAYSATDGAADELRMLSILGRVGPAAHLQQLRASGVYDRLQTARGAVEVPADERRGWRRRLVVGIRPIADPTPLAGASLGTIWLQEGRRPLDPDAGAVMEGAAAVAARLIERVRSAPTRETQQIQRLLGLRGGGVDVPSLAAALSLPAGGPAALVGLGLRDTGQRWSAPAGIAEIAAVARLHVSAYARESLVTATEDRIYVLIPRVRRAGLSGWLHGLLGRLSRRTGVDLRAAVATPVPELAALGAARSDIDRVLDRPGSEQVTTLAQSRTAVLLGEIADLVAGRDQLDDPRWQALVDDDATRNGALVASIEQYLDRFGDVRSAAEALHIHPNTLRYRIRRAEAVLGMRFDDPADRLLVQLQLLRERRSPPG